MTSTEAELTAPRHRGWHENLAIVLLVVGGAFWGFGWFAGVVLLWLSEVWTVRDKLIGTFVVPGGLSLPLLLLVFGGFGAHSAAVHALLFVAAALLAVAQVAAAVHLARCARR